MILDTVQTRRMGLRFSENAVELRRRGRFTQDEVAVRAGIHRTEVSLLERHERVPRLETILRLAGGIDAEPLELVEGLGWNLDRHPGERIDVDGDEGQVVLAVSVDMASWPVAELSPAKRFGLLLTRERLQAKLRQADLATVLAMPAPELSRYEHGVQEPRLGRILQLAAAVGVAPGDLLTGMYWIPGVTVSGGYRHRTVGESRGGADVLVGS